MNEPAPAEPLRLWPGVLAVALQWGGLFAVPFYVPDAAIFGVAGALAGAVAFGLWWVLGSRALRSERWAAMVLVVVAMAATPFILHESIAKGNMGFQFYLYGVPVLSLLFLVGAAVSQRFSAGARRATMAAAVLLACGGWALLRSDGLTSDGRPQLTWRWSQTAEERLLADADTMPAAPADVVAETPAEADWPGFRGPHRDGVIPGVSIETDWSRSPPVELWRRPIGPGVSSFAVAGGRLYTQEQRGDEEIVSCYDAGTGEPLWSHRDPKRFWDSHVGAGPRATPALDGARVYAFGATGILNALDPASGAVLWSRNAASDTEANLPQFGFVSSPLIAGDVVIVYAGALAAYDRATGEPRWFGPAMGESYSSPHLMTIDGVTQILLLCPAGLSSVSPDDGTLLWEHAWPGIGIVQPVRTAEGEVLFSMIDDAAVPVGTRRIAVSRTPEGWAVEERWTSIRLKPSFSSFVVHEGHAFGFDGRILACMDVADGRRKWKGGRYGQGQILLLPDQDLLFIVTEDGELALVAAKPERFTELARFPAIEGKTWNAPVLIRDVLLVRNGEEMAAFRLKLSGT